MASSRPGSSGVSNQASLQQSALNYSGQVVLVFEGGGALGAYQVGVYQALHDWGIEPDWIVGTSIGAINAALIVGNVRAQRLDRLKDFW
jgi:NTE family protein